MAETRQEDLIALKRAISVMRPRIDRLLTGGEKRELLKLISRNIIANVNELRAHLSRVEQMKSKRHKEQHCKLIGKIVDADARRPVSRAQVKVQHTTYDEETDTAGNFLWEGMVKGKQYMVDVTARGYRMTQYQYKATHDDEQPIVIKIAPVQRGPKGRDKNKRH